MLSRAMSNLASENHHLHMTTQECMCNSSSFPLVNNESNLVAVEQSCCGLSCTATTVFINEEKLNNGCTITSLHSQVVTYLLAYTGVAIETCRRRLLEARLLKGKSHATSNLLFVTH